MTIKLLPDQVPKLWNAIKFAAATVDRVKEKNLPNYLNKLLAALLSDKAQCFIRMDENRHLLAIALTKISIDDISGDKVLTITCVYSFQKSAATDWNEDRELLRSFAIKSGCKRIVTHSSNPRIFDLALSNGFSEQYRCYTLEV